MILKLLTLSLKWQTGCLQEIWKWIQLATFIIKQKFKHLNFFNKLAQIYGNQASPHNYLMCSCTSKRDSYCNIIYLVHKIRFNYIFQNLGNVDSLIERLILCPAELNWNKIGHFSEVLLNFQVPCPEFM